MTAQRRARVYLAIFVPLLVVALALGIASGQLHWVDALFATLLAVIVIRPFPRRWRERIYPW